ncbi:RNA polymerase sigma-70 factor, ECF subfamily [Devosia sp. LC5]|uniref:YciI family protein n=1 Tax=Devosia sp. LC5 TaxID=1502724 RepID=UPI0004E312B5|nr:YciI family protein [Devosia sp. LC5]KFC61810.1 RNA polymerase sigma-70 factor, ECF subfamily [Devosia sp. LC5]
MKYLLMLYADEKAGAAIPPEQMAGFMGKLHAYQETLEKAGAFVATAGLSPTLDAKTIKLDAGELKVHDGPYADTREQFGGYYIIEAPDINRAVELAAQCPAATWGSIEIRPFHANR